MSPKRTGSRASAKAGTQLNPMKHTGSHNGYYSDLYDSDSEPDSNSPRCDQCGKPFRAVGPKRFCSLSCAHASFRVPTLDRFWSKVEKSSACWLWTGATIRGYGQISGYVDGKKRPLYAHRLSWELEHGPISDGKVVCHHCDEPLCVRPDYLFLGSQHDNLTDARRKGRLRHPRTWARISAEDMHAIRAAYRPRHNGKALAAQYGISLTHLMRLVNAPAVVTEYQMEPVQPQPVDTPRPFDLPNSPFQLVPSIQVPVLGDVR